MELHIKERILIANIFPEKGNFSEYTMKKNILKKIAITEQDKKDYQLGTMPKLHNKPCVFWVYGYKFARVLLHRQHLIMSGSGVRYIKDDKPLNLNGNVYDKRSNTHYCE